MKKQAKHSFIAALVLTILVSCTGVFGDPADDFVGTYRFTENSSITIGSSYYPSHESGYFTIDKVSSDIVRINDLWITTGTVSGNTLQLMDHTEYSSDGHVRFSFSPAHLTGGSMTITYTSTGYYGVGIKQTITHGRGSVMATKISN